MCCREEAELRKAPEMVSNDERRGILWDAGVVEVWSEREIGINYNNLPTPENLPVADKEAAAQSIFDHEFVHNGLCHRRMKQCRNTRAELLLSVTGSTDIISTHLQLFELFSPKAFIREFVIPQTKKTMTEGGQILTNVELLLWIRLWLMMSTIQGFQCRGFWSSSTIDPIETAPYRFSCILPWTHFRRNTKCTYYHQRNTTSIQISRFGGEASGWWVESQHRHKIFTQIYILFGWVNDEVGEQIHLPGLHVYATQTLAIW